MSNVLHTARKAEKYALVEAWLKTPRKDRLSLVLFRKNNKIRKNEFTELKADIERNYQDNKMANARRFQRWAEESLEDTPEAGMTIGVWLDDHKWEILEAAFQSARNGNVQAQNLLLSALLKREGGLGDDDGVPSGKLLQQILAVQRQAREAGRRNPDNGNSEVPAESSLLP